MVLGIECYMFSYRKRHGFFWWLLLGWWLWCITWPFVILAWLFRLPGKIKRKRELDRYYAEQEERRRELERYFAEQEERKRQRIESSGIKETDYMDGHDFEYWCAALLHKNGFQNIVVTPGSGDQGVDITAYKNGTKYAVQCKCYKNKLGNTPVQEVVAGRVFYNCDKAAVMTNSYFTKGAYDLAAKNGVALWDRDYLIEMGAKTELGLPIK